MHMQAIREMRVSNGAIHAAAAASGLPAMPAGLAALESVGARVRFAPGTTIFTEGDAAAKTYRVLCGSVRLCKHMADGRRQIVDFRHAGELFGIMQLDRYAFTAEAVDDVVVVAYARAQVERLGEQIPSVRRSLFDLLSEQFLAMHRHLVMVGRQNAKERVAGFLFALAERADASDGDTVDLPMSRQDIADYLGLTIETVCRELSALKKAQIIGTPDLHSIVVRDNDRLEQLALGEPS